VTSRAFRAFCAADWCAQFAREVVEITAPARDADRASDWRAIHRRTAR
jgi:hypothetical protein